MPQLPLLPQHQEWLQDLQPWVGMAQGLQLSLELVPSAALILLLHLLVLYPQMHLPMLKPQVLLLEVLLDLWPSFVVLQALALSHQSWIHYLQRLLALQMSHHDLQGLLAPLVHHQQYQEALLRQTALMVSQQEALLRQTALVSQQKQEAPLPQAALVFHHQQ